MSHQLAGVRARIVAILCQGRGVDGSLGTEAQDTSIPAAQFRLSSVPLRDVAAPVATLHRGIHLSWVQSGTEPQNVNRRDQYVLKDCALRVEVAYLTGESATAHVYTAPSTSESASESAADPTTVAHSDALRIQAALELPSLYQSAADNPVIVDVQMQGSATTEAVPGIPMIVCTCEYRVRLWGTWTGYAPA